MKKLYCIILFLTLTLWAHSQIPTNNYILTRTMCDSLGVATIDQIQYYDGLGRPYLAVLKGAAGGNRHLASLQEYDTQGRNKCIWLPVCIEQEYNNSYDLKKKLLETYQDSLAYTSYDYHTLPLDRVTWESGPGKAWVGKGIKNDYFFNIASPDSVLSCKKYSVTDGGGRLLYDGYYKANSLSVVCNTDEDGYRSYTFKDSEGRVLLVRSCDGNVFSDTYFVYDSFGRLCYVLPPSYQENEDLDLWAYQYSYDGLGRCIKKKYPGCDEVSYVYDNADRIICSEDGVQHSRSHYTAYAYDVFGRLTSTTEMTRGSNGGRDLVNSCLRKYYDNYDFLYTPELSVIKDSLDYCELPGFGIRYVNTETPSASSCGLLTGTSVDVDLPGESFRRLYAVFYYDRYGNVIQKCSTNLLGGFERDFYSYTFTGKVASRRHVHTVPGKANCIYAETYSYDSLDRLVRVTHQQDNAPAITLFENVYDSLGRLSACVYHGVSSAPVTYSYNIRGWLTGIRHPLFSQMLYYTDGPGRACYNGNISSMSWKSGNEAVERGYKFMYDGLSRLSDALYGEGPKLSVNINRFNEQVTGYDKMGNILGLKRYGQTSATGYDVIDDLSLSYAGNRLKKVADRSGTSTFNNGFEFKDGIDLSTEYEYDENGNLTKDLNKNITAIQYNCLNLPSRVMFANGNSISYLYDAAGRKLRTVHVLEGDSVTTDYCGNVVYENGVPQILLTEAGYVSLTDGKYHYYLKDHQGNNRVVVAEEGTIEEVNHYYPFGGVFSSTGDAQPYKYNGKELDRKGGLDWYDYGARHYDSVLGRWNGVDPSCEKHYSWSPYVYCKNNPVLRIDPDGKDDYVINYHGQLQLMRRTNRIVDVLYASGTSGTVSKINPEWKNIKVFDKSILPALETNLGNNTSGADYFAETSSAYDAANIATFGIENTGVEWKYTAGYRDGEKKYIIGNSSRDYSVSTLEGINNNPFEGFQPIVDIHSHPSTQGASEHDMLNAKGKNGVSFGVYFKDNKTLYEYNSVRSNLNSIKMNSMLDLMRYTFRKYNENDEEE
jgi:RHS repeat-associated protein